MAAERSARGDNDAGLPPDAPQSDRSINLDANVDNVVVMAREILAKVNELSDNIRLQSDRISALTERVAILERQPKHTPSIWSMLVGQVLTACAVAGMLVVALDHGSTIGTSPGQTTQSTPQRSDSTGKQ